MPASKPLGIKPDCVRLVYKTLPICNRVNHIRISERDFADNIIVYSLLFYVYINDCVIYFLSYGACFVLPIKFFVFAGKYQK